MDADAAQHASSRTLLEAGRAGLVILYVTSQIICEFYSVVTNPRRVAKPCSPAAALAAISSLLGFLRVLSVPAHTIEELIRLVRRRPVTGGDIFDLQILATMNVNGIQRIYTFSTADFASFPEIAPLTLVELSTGYAVNAKLALVNDGENLLDSNIAGIIGLKRAPGNKPAIVYREDHSVKNRIVFCVERAVYKNAGVVS